jgi:CheY-like chemotaxis protein
MQPHTVLIVDDDPDFRRVLSDVLQDEGYTVVDAANGQEALQVLDTLIPDVIVLDLIMPVLNGWSLFAEIEARPELRNVPIVFLSGVPQMAPGGGSLVLKKPLDLDHLLRLLDALRPVPPSSEIRLKGAPRTIPVYRLRSSKGRPS